MRPIGIAVIGVGGFGASYLASARRMEKEGLCRIEAVVVRSVKKHAVMVEDLRSSGVRIHRDLDGLLRAESDQVRLVCIPTGIDSHARFSIAALQAGYDVLCVKPVAGSLDEAHAMREARDRSGRTLAVGFQDIFTPSVQRIKSIALGGRLGRLRSARAYLSWPRTQVYYQRNAWAGRLAVDGVPVLDCPIQNAAGHYLHQMLYVAGPSPHEALEPQWVYAENYRCKEIESADTQFVRVGGGRAGGGVTVSLLASHAVRRFAGPTTHYQFEKGVVVWEKEAEGRTGFTRVYRHSTEEANAGPAEGATLSTAGAGAHAEAAAVPFPAGRPFEEFCNGSADPHDAVFEDTLKALAEARPPLSTIDNAVQHTKVVQAAFRSAPIITIPGEFVEPLATRSGKPDGAVGLPTINRIIRGYDDRVPEMFCIGSSPAEIGLPWARRGRIVSTNC